nr:GHKL domain-containing protein [Bacteroidota bacterium]
MTYSYRFKIITRVIVLGISMYFFTFALYQTQWYVTSTVLGVLSLTILAELIYFTENWKREFKKFLMSIKYRDFTGYYYDEKLKKDIPEYKFAFKEISKEFQHIRIEKELHYQYLQTIVSHIKTVLLCFEGNGKIRLVNHAALKLFGIHQMGNINQIERISKHLYDTLVSKKMTEELIKISIKGRLYQLAMQRTFFTLGNQELTLISLKDIKNELEENELDSWKKLIQVLTHEIMNSATPIASLSKAMKDLLAEFSSETNAHVVLTGDDFVDLKNSISSIENRSRGMLKFADDYKNLSSLPQPKFDHVDAGNIITYVVNLVKPELDSRNIAIKTDIPPGQIKLFADQEMIQRLLLNLILNAMYACEKNGRPEISVAAQISEGGKAVIRVSDNGHGIKAENLDKIFIPFFSTRKGGSGLGLSISREIIRLHRGTIEVQSIEAEGTTFAVVL